MSLAFVFPGQGSQSPGMQAALALAYGQLQETYREASEVLGFDLWRLTQEGPNEKLDETVVTQPAMLTAGVAAWRVWQAEGGATPRYMAGHSLGEYTALVCAGALGFVDALRLVGVRAAAMQAAVPAGQGAMAAVLGLDDDTVAQVCRDAAEGDVVSAVNFNSPGQVVIAGSRAAVERAAELARAAGARRAMLLSVSVPSHCELMQPAAERLEAALADTDFRTPQIDVLSNVDVSAYRDAAQIRDGLVRQLCNPVRWVETVRHMAEAGVTTVVECGPGKVLTGLNRRIDKSLAGHFIETPESLRAALDHQPVQQTGSEFHE